VEILFCFFALGVSKMQKTKKIGTKSPTPHFSCGGTPK
jgi:hypothetical protein